MAATYALVPSTKLADRPGVIGVGGLLLWVGTITASGTYTTGGDTFPAGGSPEDVLKRIGAGQVLDIRIGGIVCEWDATNKKLKINTGTVPVAEIASGAALATVTGRQVVITGR